MAGLFKLRVLLCWATLGLVASGAFGGPVACGQRPIRLAFYETGVFYFEDEKKQGHGIDKDLVDELTKRSGCNFDIRLMARARIWEDLANGALDMSVSGIQNEARDRFAWFAHYLIMKNYALLHSDVASNVNRPEAFLEQKSLRFGVVRAFKHGLEQDQWLDQLRAQQRVEESPDVETIFRKLKDHRIDAVFSQPPTYTRELEKLGMGKGIVVQDWTPKEKGVPHGLILAKSRFSESDAVQWRTLIGEMRADGTLKTIYSRYLNPAEVGKLLAF